MASLADAISRSASLRPPPFRPQLTRGPLDGTSSDILSCFIDRRSVLCLPVEAYGITVTEYERFVEEINKAIAVYLELAYQQRAEGDGLIFTVSNKAS